MKKNLFLALLSLLFFASCVKDTVRHTYTLMRPVYKEKSEVYAAVKSESPKPVQQPGKIYLYGTYLFWNEVDKGVHVIDNSNPAQPQVRAFIPIPGNLDIAVKGNTLYADLYADLLAIDISDPLQARLRHYVPHVFPDRQYEGGFLADSTRVIVDWIRKDTTVTYEVATSWRESDAILFSGGGPQSFAAAGGTPAGTGGSMARFCIVNDYLYCLNKWQIRTFGLQQPQQPVQVGVTEVQWNIETIYPFQNKLFIGADAGMFIYDISQPGRPVREGQFLHARACDPVVTDGNHAYVTLRNGTQCTGTSNQLDVVNVNNLSNPTLLRTYAMTNPHGLAKDGNRLFLCDGRDGLKVFDVSNPAAIVLKQHIKGLHTYDVIARQGNLLLVADEGLCQFDYSNPDSLVQRSRLVVTR